MNRYQNISSHVANWVRRSRNRNMRVRISFEWLLSAVLESPRTIAFIVSKSFHPSRLTKQRITLRLATIGSEWKTEEDPSRFRDSFIRFPWTPQHDYVGTRQNEWCENEYNIKTCRCKK